MSPSTSLPLAPRLSPGAAELDVGLIRLSLNSPGGSVLESLAIYYRALWNHPARVEAKVEGYAASMATVIAQAADEIPENTVLRGRRSPCCAPDNH